MSVMQALFSFKGRMTRRDYWLKGVIFLSPLSVLISTLLLVDSVIVRVLSLVLSVLLLWPGLALTAKRLHDRGRSGWFIATLLIPAADIVFGVLIFIWVGFLRGTEGANRFGEDPRKSEPAGAPAEAAASRALFRPAGFSPSLEIIRVPAFFENASWRAISSTITFWSLCLGIIMLLNVARVVTPMFYDPRNVGNIFTDFLPFALMAMPMALILSNGGVDFSIGSVVSLSSVLMATTLSKGGSLPAAIILTLGVALLVGLVNGFMVGVMRWPGFLITLAMLFIARTVGLLISDARMIPVQGDLPAGPGQAIVGWALLAVLLILLVVWIQYPGFAAREKGRGAKPRSGVSHAFEVGAPYILSSLVAAFAGIMLFTRIRAGTSSLGTNYEFYVLLAVVLAGVYPGARYGNAVAVLFGAFVVAVLRNILMLNNASVFVQGVLLGVLFVLALVYTFALNAIMGLVYRARHQAGHAAPVAQQGAGVEKIP
jgi:ribose/xylose/arabinose/galactoside ABC-type transport system permease subunit/uncharacterized membrane protein YhaH (DUF805 family)